MSSSPAIPTRVKRVAPGIGGRRPHPMWRCHFADGADWPVRADPFARRMRQLRREVDQAGSQVNRGGLHRRDLLLAQGLTHDFQAAGERRITERAFHPAARNVCANGSQQRHLRIGQLRLRLGERSGDRADIFARPLDGIAPRLEGDRS